MSGQLLMFDLTICGPIVDRNVISLPGLGDGALRSGLLDGLTTDLFGRVLVPVSRSAERARVRRPMTGVTCGLRGFLSSASAGLQSCLESRLRRRLAGAGSTLFSLIWRRKATPAGRPYYQLVASARRTSGTDFGSWPTPTARDYRSESATDEFNERRWGDSRGKPLSAEATLASWPTPDTMSGPHGPRGASSNPAHQSAKGLEAIGRTVIGSPAATEKRGQLNPAHSRWLMGYPAGWDACAPTATRSSRKSRPNS